MKERVPTNMRALLILEAIGKHTEPMTPTQLARLLALPKQTVHRVCHTLVDEGFLARSAGGGLRPARRLRQIAVGTLQASDHFRARHQILVRFAQTVGETVNYVMPRDKGMHYVDRVETDWAMRVQLPIGTDVPFHCTASGKTFMAMLPIARRRSMVESLDMKAMTDRTITDSAAMFEELQVISEQGYALDREEFVDGMVAIAVPVTDGRKRFIAALAFHGPTTRMQVESLPRWLPQLQETANQLARLEV